jgi:hypothetical protein
MDIRLLTAQERQFRNMLKLNLLGIAALQRSHWRQRARLAWLKDGDANTSFFHSKASARRRKKMILSLMQDEQILTSQEGKLELIHNFFMDLIGTHRQRHHSLRLHELGIIPSDQHDLEADFTETEVKVAIHEVKVAIHEINVDKAPGLDGFTGRFFQNCWNTVKPKMLAAVQAFVHLQTAEL